MAGSGNPAPAGHEGIVPSAHIDVRDVPCAGEHLLIGGPLGRLPFRWNLGNYPHPVSVAGGQYHARRPEHQEWPVSNQSQVACTVMFRVKAYPLINSSFSFLDHFRCDTGSQIMLGHCQILPQKCQQPQPSDGGDLRHEDQR